MKPILIIGASGFVGGRLARTLLADGLPVRCLARIPAKVADLADAGCEIVQGDIADAAAVQGAVQGAQAVYISIHTLSPQPSAAAGAGFMDVEKTGLQNVIAACQASGVRRVIYVTSLGIGPDEKSEWLSERWRAEQVLLTSGLDATVIRPGCIIGVGGHGFNTVEAAARRRVAITLFGDTPRMRMIALDDLVYYLRGVRDEPRTYGQTYDVGNDDVMPMKHLVDVAADVLGRPHPTKIQIPLAALGGLAPLIEAMAKLPKGAFRGLLEGMKVECIGDPHPIRAILPRPLLTAREAVARALR